MRRETGKKQVVRVHYGEGVAIHIDPESCAGAREGIGEALTGERIGQDIEPRKQDSTECRRRQNNGRQHGRAHQRERLARLGVVGDPGMCRNSLRGSREASGLACGWTPQVRIGKTRSRSR